jgi:hypothetical protein
VWREKSVENSLVTPSGGVCGGSNARVTADAGVCGVGVSVIAGVFVDDGLDCAAAQLVNDTTKTPKNVMRASAVIYAMKKSSHANVTKKFVRDSAPQ